MKKLQSFLALVLAMTILLTATPQIGEAALAALPAPVQNIYDRTDKGVLEGKPGTSWVWGPRVQDNTEDYKESPGGKRQVYYFEKGRLEISYPDKNPADKYYVTSGLLLREMITGQQQNGDATLSDRGPANVVLAGDFAAGVPDSPTYASLLNLVSFDGSWKSNDLSGQAVDKLLALGGAITTRPDLSQGVVYAQYYKETGHNVAKPFVDFMNKKGLVYQNGGYVDNQPLFDPLYVFGYPIAEPYWAHVTVAGKVQYVLVQAFERRLLTYTPGNPDPYKVELGNLGLAYTQWRYKIGPAPFNYADPDYARPTETDGFKVYNAVNSNMRNLTAVKRSASQGGKVYKTEQYQAPNRARFLEEITYSGKPATLETIVTASRTYRRLLAGGVTGKWFYEENDTPFSWPAGFRDFRVYSLNDWTLNWQAGAVTNSGADVTRLLNVNYTDIDGSKIARNRQVSVKNNLVLSTGTEVTLPDGSKSQIASAYSEFNVANKIDEPVGASPLNSSAELPLTARPDRVLVKLKEDYRANFSSSLNGNFGNFRQSFEQSYSSLKVAQGWSSGSDDLLSLYSLNGADLDATLNNLRADSRVEYAEPDYIRKSFISQFNDPSAGDQYYLKAIHAPRAWDFSTGARSITVAVIDSGIDLENPDLKGNISDVYNSRNNNTNVNDQEGHGSWTAGIIGALGNNKIYGSGLAWNAKIIAIRADSDDNPGSFSDSSIIKAVRYATDKGARVINMSLGGEGDSKALRDGVAYATDRGVLVIASSGNSGNDVPNYPASFPKVISVGATGWLGQPASFSSYGSKVILSAPGVSICNTVRAGQFACLDGTSASAPVVSGVAVLVWSVNPYLNADQVKAILIASATPAPGKQVGQRDDKYGYGVVDAAKAVRMAATNELPNLPKDIPQ